MAKLDELEARLESLLEVHLVKYLPGYQVEDGIAQQLAVAMHRHSKDEAGVPFAPTLYVIVGHPLTIDRWKDKPGLLSELANALYIAGQEAGFKFSSVPTLNVIADEEMSSGELRIMVSFTSVDIGETQGSHGTNLPETGSGTIPSNAFLIIGGIQVIQLNRSVFNIGRRLDNHIVIDDPRVSRAHAQLRIIKDRFVLFDLNSSGGSFVNGQRISQSVLYPGDVISLAGVSIIFGQDLPNWKGPFDGHTSPAPPISGERPTAVLGDEIDGNEK
jgi:hypothetical protein